MKAIKLTKSNYGQEIYFPLNQILSVELRGRSTVIHTATGEIVVKEDIQEVMRFFEVIN